jgi:hypothetical protein
MMHLAVHVPCDNADTEDRVADELTGFLNPNRLYAFMSSILVNRNHAIAVQLTESPAISLEFVSIIWKATYKKTTRYILLFLSPADEYTILED